jgi:hypothetical protein
MANNYLQMSFILDCGTNKAREDVLAYANKVSEAIRQDIGEGDEESPFDLDSIGLSQDNSSCSYERDEETGIWFYGEEGFDFDYVEEILKYAIKKYKLPPMGFTWAATCSKMRLDEFDGGAVFFKLNKETGEVDIEYTSGHGWLEKKLNEAKKNG